MHPTPVFHNHDTDAALDFIAAHPFATLAVNGARGPITAIAPLVLGKQGQTLLGHVARTNPFWKIVQEGSTQAVAVFHGPDAYVSPSAYPSKKEHGRVVPTWNYIAAEVRGTVRLETNPEGLLSYITTLTDKMESPLYKPWQVLDAPADYIAKLSRAIIGFDLEIEDITYVRKLSQNKSSADRSGVIAAFKASNDPQMHRLAREMKTEMATPTPPHIEKEI